MAVLVLFKWEGDPDEHLAAYDRELRHPVPRDQPRRISYTCARGDDGIPHLRVRRRRNISCYFPSCIHISARAATAGRTDRVLAFSSNAALPLNTGVAARAAVVHVGGGVDARAAAAVG